VVIKTRDNPELKVNTIYKKSEREKAMKRNLKDVKLTWNSPMIISNPTHKLTPIYIIDSYENRETKEVQIEYALMPHNEQTRKSETFYASSINTVVHIENKPKYKIYSDGLGIRGG